MYGSNATKIELDRAVVERTFVDVMLVEERDRRDIKLQWVFSGEAEV